LHVTVVLRLSLLTSTGLHLAVPVRRMVASTATYLIPVSGAGLALDYEQLDSPHAKSFRRGKKGYRSVFVRAPSGKCDLQHADVRQVWCCTSWRSRIWSVDIAEIGRRPIWRGQASRTSGDSSRNGFEFYRAGRPRCSRGSAPWNHDDSQFLTLRELHAPQRGEGRVDRCCLFTRKC